MYTFVIDKSIQKRCEKIIFNHPDGYQVLSGL